MNTENRRNAERFTVEGKEVTLYLASEAGRPLIVFNNYEGDGSSVLEAVRAVEKTDHANFPYYADRPDFHFLCVGNLDWNQDMSPWYCPPLFSKDTPYTGGADDYLSLLQDRILPKALEKINGTPPYIGIAGYSLAGLFAIYALYRTDIFDRAASMSGSLWFPDFKDYVMTHKMLKKPQKLYFSLGDKEARTRNQLMRSVQDHTESVVAFYREEGLDVTWEMNPGNHFKDAELRSAKGILAIL